MAHPNEALLRGAYDAFSAGDIPAVLSVFSGDIEWHTSSGNNPVAGNYRGHDGVVEYFGKLMEHTGGTFRLDVHDVVANDDHGFVAVTLHAERNGRSLEVKEVHVWHLEGGKASEFWEATTDQGAGDAFFA